MKIGIKDVFHKIHIISGMLFFGTGSTVTMKLQLDMDCIGYDGITHTFDKPIFQTILMFFVMEVDVFRFKQTTAISSSNTNEHNGCKNTSNSTPSPFFKTTTSGFVLMRYRSFPSKTLS